MESLAEFYTHLGLKFDRHSHGSGPEHFSAEYEGLVFEIYPASSPDQATSGIRIGFTVQSLNVTHARLIHAGAVEVSAPSNSQWGQRSVITDPDGHRVELLQLQ